MVYYREAMPIPREATKVKGKNIFKNAKINTSNNIPQQIKVIQSHQCPPLHVKFESKALPLPTNDNTTSFLVKNAGVPNYQQPYIYTITEQNEIAVSSTNFSRKVRGDNYIYNPVGINDLLFSLSNPNKTIQVEPLTAKDGASFAFGSNLIMSTDDGISILKCPIVQGAGLVSLIMAPKSSKLEIGSSVGISQFEVFNSSVYKNTLYNITLHNSTTWLMKITSKGHFEVTFENGIAGISTYEGCLVQFFPVSIAKELGASVDELFIKNLCFGFFANSFDLFSDGESNSMSFNYDIKNYLDDNDSNCKGLIFLLPHHLNILATETKDKKTNLSLWSSVYGIMSGFIERRILFSFFGDNINKYDVFQHESVLTDSMNVLVDYMADIKDIVIKDLEGANISKESDLNSMYFAGKIINKYAWLLLISHRILHDDELSQKIFNTLTDALNRFISNKQQLPLVYDNHWKGLISSGSSGEDFGNSYYNDHHFHYGYFVMSFAIIADYNFDWFEQNKAYSDLLLKDYCNIDMSDLSFINYRNFNWYSGHSWANGVWPSLDGKDQESSSEDYNSIYAMYLYGSVTKNKEMKEIAKLQLNCMKQSNICYFLYQNNNNNIFKELVPNKVAGIFFQNKIDYATYFGKNTEYIHMIHFIPGTFISEYIRPKQFVKEEWFEKLSNIKIQGNGWNGLLKLNQSMIDSDAVNFFKDKNLDKSNLDSGQSQAFSFVLSLLWQQNM
ncbi:hypothetical protein QEN19_001872 [Hanseniaspora menglaensis]